jgi:ATP-dependent Zn protease
VGDVIVNLLPFLLLIGFWVFLMRHMRSGAGVPNPTVDKLEQIRQELERIRRAVESDSFRTK